MCVCGGRGKRGYALIHVLDVGGGTKISCNFNYPLQCPAKKRQYRHAGLSQKICM